MKVESLDFADRLDRGSEKKELRLWLKSQKDGIALTWDGPGV